MTTGIVTGSKYRFRVLAKNSVGFSLPSTHIEMMPATTPGSPSTPTLTDVTSSSIQISWTFNEELNGGTPITDYIVYWDAGISGNTEVAAASTGLWGTFTATDVQAGETYGFWVVAVNYIGTGTASSKLSVLSSQVPDAPAIPVATASYNSYQVTWVPPNAQGAAITYYTVYVDEDGNNTDDFVEVTTTTNTFYNVASGVIQGTIYKFKITATN